MLESFFGELHPHDFKDITSKKSSRSISPPPYVVIPMSLHSGVTCTPTVAVGDYVKMGQKIGDSNAPVSAPVHASVSGKVIAIEPKLHTNGSKVISVVIENDGNDTLSEEVVLHRSENLSDPEVLCRIVREAGIVGMGGAVFPTAEKIRTSVGEIDTLIINGAECEPYITSDHRLMLEHPDELLEGIRILKRVYGLPYACIGIETNKPDAISLLSSKRGNDIKIYPLKPKFPQGDRKQIIKTIIKQEIPPGGSSSSVRSVVFNVNTVYAIYRAVHKGMPLIQRTVTVAGDAVNSPDNFICRIGTPIEQVFEAAGGFNQSPFKVLVGGPMTGTTQYDLSVPVTKGTNALLALSKRRDRSSENPVCIRCGRCAEVCPMRLVPMYLHMYAEKDDIDGLEKYHVADCIECGMCTFVCPGRLYITQSCRLGKTKLKAAGRGLSRREEGAKKNG